MTSPVLRFTTVRIGVLAVAVGEQAIECDHVDLLVGACLKRSFERG